MASLGPDYIWSLGLCQVHLFWVEDVDIYGTATRHGPVSVDYGAPTAVRVLDAGTVTSLPLALPLVGAGLLALAGLAARRRRRG